MTESTLASTSLDVEALGSIEWRMDWGKGEERWFGCQARHHSYCKPSRSQVLLQQCNA